MKLRNVLAAGIIAMTMCASCASGGQTAAEAPARQETSAEQGVSAEQEEPVEAEASEGRTAAKASEEKEGAVEAEASEGRTAAEAAGKEEQAGEKTASADQQAAAEQKEEFKKQMNDLFGEGGPLAGFLPEGADPDKIVDAAGDKLDQSGRKAGQGLDEVLDYIQSQSDKLSEESLEKYAEEILNHTMGLGTGAAELDAFDELDEIIKIYEGISEVENEYIKERNAGIMDCGEVQIFSNDPFYDGDDLSQEESKFLKCIIENNYNMNEQNQLLFVSSSEDVVLFTHEKAEDGSYPVREARFAEEGDNYMPSIEAMYREIGQSPDEFREDLEMDRIFVLYDLIEYLDEHPEVKGIEFEGEIRTAEELEDLWSARLDEVAEKEANETAGKERTAEEAASETPSQE